MIILDYREKNVPKIKIYIDKDIIVLPAVEGFGTNAPGPKGFRANTDGFPRIQILADVRVWWVAPIYELNGMSPQQAVAFLKRDWDSAIKVLPRNFVRRDEK